MSPKSCWGLLLTSHELANAHHCSSVWLQLSSISICSPKLLLSLLTAHSRGVDTLPLLAGRCCSRDGYPTRRQCSVMSIISLVLKSGHVISISYRVFQRWVDSYHSSKACRCVGDVKIGSKVQNRSTERAISNGPR